jgi:hypothetical protein
MEAMVNKYYRLSVEDRRRLLADAGFTRNAYRIWSHADGRALGDGVTAALTDEALLRYLRIAPASVLQNNSKKRKIRPRKAGK